MKIENPSQQFLPSGHHKLAAFSDEVHEAMFREGALNKSSEPSQTENKSVYIS